MMQKKQRVIGGERIEVGVQGYGRDHRNAKGVASDGSHCVAKKFYL